MAIQTKTKKNGLTTYYANVYNSKTGKRICGPRRESRKDAVKDEADILQKLEIGIVEEKKKDRKTLDEVYNLWADAADGHYAASTLHTYKQYYKRYIKNIFGDKLIVKVTPEHIQFYINNMSQKFSAETVNKCVNIISVLFRFTKDTLRIIRDNPCDFVVRKKVTPPTKTVWTLEQCSYFLTTPEVRGSMWYPMLLLSLAVGLRPGEVCGIQERDLVNNILALDNGYDRQRNLTTMKTPQSHRGIPLPDHIYNPIQKFLLWKKEIRLRYSEFANNGFLFVSQEGMPITPDGYYRRFKALLHAHNNRLQAVLDEGGKIPVGSEILPEISLYDCRHSFATNTIRDESPEVVANIMGNSVKTLLTRYAHVSTGLRQDAVERYAEKLSQTQ